MDRSLQSGGGTGFWCSTTRNITWPPSLYLAHCMSFTYQYIYYFTFVLSTSVSHSGLPCIETLVFLKYDLMYFPFNTAVLTVHVTVYSLRYNGVLVIRPGLYTENFHFRLVSVMAVPRYLIQLSCRFSQLFTTKILSSCTVVIYRSFMFSIT
jgi:hypothetical protein